MRKRIIMMIVGVALMALPAMAQTFGAQQAEQPNATFQSTSSMSGSGSQYSANPSLNSDGTAVYTSASSPAKAPGGPRREMVIPTPPGGGGDKIPQEPIGDAVLPLMLMAVAWAMFVYFRRKQTLKG